MDKRHLSQYLVDNVESYQFSQVVRVLISISDKAIVTKTKNSGRYQSNEVYSIRETDDEIEIVPNVTSLTGVKGILPHYFQDALRLMSSDKQSYSFHEFVNIFNSILLEKEHRANTYESLALYFELDKYRDLEYNKHFLDMTGLSFFYNDFNMRFSNSLSHLSFIKHNFFGIDRLMSCYFNIPIKIVREKINLKNIERGFQWSLGKKNTILGGPVILGKKVAMAGNSIIVHIKINTSERWNVVQNDTNLKNELARLCQLFLSTAEVKFVADISYEVLENPRLNMNFRLGQYNVFKPYHNQEDIVSVTFTGQYVRDN